MAKTKTKGPAPQAAPAEPAPKPRLKLYYEQTVRPKLGQQFGFANPHQIPRLVKIVLNVGEGEGMKNAKLLDVIVDELGRITGQRPVVTRAKKSIANFNLRQGMAIGASVTLRGARMYEFLDRLISIAMPRIRDFRGVSPRAFDGRGNFSLGVKEQIIFPEIQYDQIDQIRGMDITITTTAKDNRQGRALLEAFNFPFRK
jgi:large subunit ribosomal protein L5